VFAHTVKDKRNNAPGHLNTFMERNQIQVMCDHLGFKVVDFIDGAEARWNGEPLGQSICVLQKPPHA
jgi:hypothetical protein